MKMNVLELIKNRHTTRKYKDMSISKKLINKIIEAGIWGPSVHGFQPWRFVIITNALLIKKISNLLLKKSDELRSLVLDRILSLTANTIANAPVVIFVYNQNIFKELSSKFYHSKKEEISENNRITGIRIAELSEIEAIAAAIQNMLLLAHDFGIGACWNTIPLLCELEINKLLREKGQLVAVITIGYPDKKSKRLPRKALNKMVKYFN